MHDSDRYLSDRQKGEQMKITGKYTLELPVVVEFEISGEPTRDKQAKRRIKRAARRIEKDAMKLQRLLSKMERGGWKIKKQEEADT